MKFFLVMTVFAFSSWAQAKNVRRIPSSIKSFDGFSLPYSLEVPEGMKKEDVKSVVVFVHGSGPNDMNEDLSDGSVPKGVQNLVFKDISDALLSQGIATVRYNKRSYEITVRLERDPKTKESQEYKNLMAHPFKYYIDDLAAVVDFAHKEFPNAKMNILGHSEGTGVAIYVASKKSFINGVCLIGFSNESTEVNLFEQIVYRSLHIFDSLDINHDGVIDSNELNANNDTAKALKAQLTILDLDKDGKVSLSEFKAGNYLNLVAKEEIPSVNYRSDEASLPRKSDLIEKAKYKILFLQGEWDNQTPAYFTQSIEMANINKWKKTDLKFVYFPKAGHELDPRDSYNDIFSRKIPSETLKKISEEIKGFLN